jgi:hypothetical protein
MNQYKLKSGFNVRKYLIATAVVLLVGYAIFNARNLILGPSIELLSPTVDQIDTNENTITIKGRVKNMTYLSLNERPISASSNGIFEEKVLLSPGFNVIEIKVRDRFKKEIEKIVKVYYKQT